MTTEGRRGTDGGRGAPGSPPAPPPGPVVPPFDTGTFIPAPWVRGPHAQTLAARVRRSPHGPELRRERIETPDGDFLHLDWGPEPRGRPDHAVALLLHGLEGSARRRYVRNVARELLARGVRPVAMNFRGCSGEPNRTLRLYHSGETHDPRLVLELLRSRFPDRRIGAVGFSLGGNVLLKLLGESPQGGRGLVDAAVAMSVPFDLAAGADLLERTRMGRLYSEYFLRSLKRKVHAKAKELRTAVPVERVARVRTIRDFDELVTAPLHGFEGSADYYERCSSARYLDGIRTPTLLLHAADDPFLPSASVPVAQAEANPAVLLSLQEAGGHVGFLAGTLRAPHFWGDVQTARFLAHTLTSSDV